MKRTISIIVLTVAIVFAFIEFRTSVGNFATKHETEAEISLAAIRHVGEGQDSVREINFIEITISDGENEKIIMQCNRREWELFKMLVEITDSVFESQKTTEVEYRDYGND